MSSQQDSPLQKVKDYYSGRVRSHGATPSGVDWSSRESQALRHQQLLRLLDGVEGPVSINDYGCGYGALLEVLDEMNDEISSYCGYDISSDMLRVARERFGDRHGVCFTQRREDLPVADFTLASGIFNVKLDCREVVWREHVLATLHHLAGHSRKGFGFNLLSTYSDLDRRRSDLHYANPCRLFDYCKRRFSRSVALLHDYGLYEFTILVRCDEEKSWRV